MFLMAPGARSPGPMDLRFAAMDRRHQPV